MSYNCEIMTSGALDVFRVYISGGNPLDILLPSHDDKCLFHCKMGAVPETIKHRSGFHKYSETWDCCWATMDDSIILAHFNVTSRWWKALLYTETFKDSLLYSIQGQQFVMHWCMSKQHIIWNDRFQNHMSDIYACNRHLVSQRWTHLISMDSGHFILKLTDITTVSFVIILTKLIQATPWPTFSTGMSPRMHVLILILLGNQLPFLYYL